MPAGEDRGFGSRRFRRDALDRDPARTTFTIGSNGWGRGSLRLFLALYSGAVVSSMALDGAVRAESAAPAAAEAERYRMTPAEGGFLRLDTASGSVSFCTVAGGQSLCRAGADETAALEAEISRLRRENAELRDAASALPSARQDGASNLPSEAEFERTLSLTERFLRRILQVFRDAAPPDECRR